MAKSKSSEPKNSVLAEKLRDLGVKKNSALIKMANNGQLLKLKCEMPQCYHEGGRRAFDPVKSKPNSWAPSQDHYPILKSAGGKLVPENIRLSHVRCNHLDFVRRNQIGLMLAKGNSLAEIAEYLNRKSIPPTRGTKHWTATMVRSAYVS